MSITFKSRQFAQAYGAGPAKLAAMVAEKRFALQITPNDHWNRKATPVEQEAACAFVRDHLQRQFGTMECTWEIVEQDTGRRRCADCSAPWMEGHPDGWNRGCCPQDWERMTLEHVAEHGVRHGSDGKYYVLYWEPRVVGDAAMPNALRCEVEVKGISGEFTLHEDALAASLREVKQSHEDWLQIQQWWGPWSVSGYAGWPHGNFVP